MAASQGISRFRGGHMKLSRAYRQAPDWWYIALGAGMFAMALDVCEGWDTRMVYP
jgi:hypothetical protein